MPTCLLQSLLLPRKVIKLLGLCLILLFINDSYATDLTNPVGRWQTIDDKTNKPRSIIFIWEKRGELMGTIEQVNYQAGEKATDVCVKCSGKLHNQLILGMMILWGMQKHGNTWEGGSILDPSNGNVYHCRMTLQQAGKALDVRGYIGVPLLGRTQTWLRLADK